MKKIYVVYAFALLLVVAPTALAQYGYGMGMNYGWGAGTWLVMAILGLIWLIVVSFVFSWIFWGVAARMFERKMTEKHDWKMKECAKDTGDAQKTPAQK